MDEANPVYLQPATIKAIRQTFKENGSVQLGSFLTASAFSAMKLKPAGQSYVPDKHRYTPLTGNTPFEQQVFADLVFRLTGKVLKGKPKAYSFGKGDYTLLHDEISQPEGLYVFFDLESADPAEGGYTSFVHHHEELARVIGVKNALTIVQKPKNCLYFTKYVNHHAQGKRTFVLIAP